MKIRLMHPAVGEIAFPLKPGGSLVVGRLGSATDVEISWDPRISRRHCRLWERDGRIWFQDLASRNGSWIGSDRVSGVVRLAPGASVLIGETVLLIPAAKSGEETVAEETHERPATPAELEALEQLPPHFDEAPPTLAIRSAAALDAGTATMPPITESCASPAPSTMDLRGHAEPGPLAHGVENKVRATPRFVSPTRVHIRAAHREELQDLWVRDISKGGLFVETTSAPPPGTPVEVELDTPAGRLTLRGLVVHVLSEQIAASFGGKPGVGVQFIDLGPQTRDAIQAYIEGCADRFERPEPGQSAGPTTDSLDQAVQRARKFLHDAEAIDFYAALELRPTVGAAKIEETLNHLHRSFSESARRAPPPQAARLEAALNLLGRARRILTQEEGRLDYDFRNGHIRAKERIAAAHSQTGPDLSTLRNAWNRVFPDRVDRAALLTRKAFASRQRQDFAAAIDAGRAALALNPFFEELEQTVEVWESVGAR